MQNGKRNDTNELIYKTETDTHLKNERMVTCVQRGLGGKEGGRDS